MDWVRSCYRTDMRMSAGEDASLVRVKWYFVDPGTRLFPGYNRYASRNWDASKEPTEWVGQIGEAYITPPERPWRNGVGSPRPGCHDCGCCPSPWWTDGVPWPWPQLYPVARLCLDGSARFAGPRSWIGMEPLRLGGAAIFENGRTFFGTEPLRLGGTNQLWAPYHWHGRNPLKIDGAATFRHLQILRGREPLKIGGAATFTHTYTWHGSTPLKIGGAASFPAAINPARLPLKIGGAAQVVAGRVWTGEAPLFLGGEATFEGQGTFAGEAPLELGGEATFGGQGTFSGVAPLKIGGVATFAGFGMATPSGGCGSLPTVLVLRLGSGTGTCTCANGTQATLTFNGVSQWTGGATYCSASPSTFTLSCAGGNWILNGGGGVTIAATHMVGTSGPSPNLTGVIVALSTCSGQVTATITRT